MIAAEEERLGNLPARLIELEVPRGVVELLMLDDQGLGVAKIAEYVVVEE